MLHGRGLVPVCNHRAAQGAAFSAAGVSGAAVEPIGEGRIAAVVSRLSRVSIRPQRSNLAAHHRLLQDLALRQPVLPVVFGTIIGSEAELREHPPPQSRRPDCPVGPPARESGNGAESLLGSPQRLRVLCGHPSGAGVDADGLFRPGRAATVEEKIDLGRLFESLAPAGPRTAHATGHGDARPRIAATCGKSMRAKNG